MTEHPVASMRLELFRALRRALGAEPGLAVIHSSLPELGPPAGFQKWDALYAIQRLATDGWTIALPAFTFSYCRGTAYDHLRSPSEVGILADWVLHLLPGAVRTHCPIYSFVVIGPQAGVLASLRSETVWGMGSIFEYAERHDARIVMLGCGWKYCTQFHRYEEGGGVPYRYYKEFSGLADFGDGAVETMAKMYVRDLEVQARNDFAEATARMRDAALVTSVPLWRGTIEAVSADRLASLLRDMIKEDPLCLVGERAVVRHRMTIVRQEKQNPPHRIAVLGHSTLDLLAASMREQFREYATGRRLELHTVPFGQLRQEIINEGSDLHAFDPEMAIFCDRLEDLAGDRWYDIERAALLDQVDSYAELVARYHTASGGWSIVHLFARTEFLADAEQNIRASDLVFDLNKRLRECLAGLPRLTWIDTAQEIAMAGAPIADARLWRVGRIPYGDVFSRRLARRWCAFALALLGKSARLIVLDLDNTLWGGVLGEDGIEGLQIGGDYPGNAFFAFQSAIKTLNKRGIALAVCSKNDASSALAAMDHISDMPIRSQDLSAHRINWEPKSANILDICAELNLGAESVLFVDDNPVEREEVRRNVPGIKILELPDDPSSYADTLMDCPWVAGVQFTAEDAARVKSYEIRRRIGEERQKAASLEDFIRDLGMKIHLQPLSASNTARAVQLCQKTNQFNTTTKRYTQRDLEAILARGGEVIVVGLEDKHATKENIGLIVLVPVADMPGVAEIDLYLLSCRVLGRGLETALVEWVCGHARHRGQEQVRGRIVETERNQPVRSVFQRAGFTLDDATGYWSRALAFGTELPASYDWIDSCTETKGVR